MIGVGLGDIFMRITKDESSSMSAEPRQVIDTEAWRQWEHRVVNDVFPLRRFLGGSDHSAVFLSEYKAKNLADVAIKFVPVDTSQPKAQIAQWRAAAKHPHPRLVRMFAVGQCQSGGSEFLFVVMEYAEQTLAQLLPQRALSIDEAQELLPPTLDALAFLHGNHMVHSRLKPSNFMVVNDQLKLTSDTLRPVGHIESGGDRTSPYHPPELKDRGTSPAGDIWGLGITLVEALTQRAPAWPERQGETAALPPGFPAPFVDTVRRCLSLAPANRPTAIKLAAHYKSAPQAKPISNPKPPAQEAPRKTSPPQSAPKRNLLLPVSAAALLIALAVGAGLHFSDTQHAQSQAAAAPTPAPVAPAVVSKPMESNPGAVPAPVSTPPDQPSPPPEATSPAVLHEVTPDVSQAARDRIKGHIYVTLRVLVDPAGDVFGALMENPGPSKHFARLAGDAAREWKFVPADSRGARVWLLRFDFSRDGVTARATAL
jgi:serine/threonine protein kinase